MSVTTHERLDSRLSVVGDTSLTAFAPLVWGTTYIVTTQLLPSDVPMMSAVLRAIPAALLILMIVPGTIPRHWWLKVFVLGVLNIGLFFPLLFFAAYRLPGGIAAVVGSLQPLVIAALSAALGWGRVGFRQLIWLVLAAVGVSLAVLTGAQQLDLLGMAAAVLGTVSMGVGILLTRRWGSPPGVRPVTMTGWQLLVGGLVIAPLVPVVDTGTFSLDLPALLGYIWLAVVGGAVAYALWFRGARMLPATNTSLLGLLSPLMAAALGWIILHQSMSILQLAGFVLALVSSLLGQRRATLR